MPDEFKKTSTEERKFRGGAQRDAAVGKGAPHWMPSVALFLVSRIYENGNIQRDKLSGGPGQWRHAELGKRHADQRVAGQRRAPHFAFP